MKLLILILSADSYPYNELEDIIRETWIKEKPDNVNVFFVRCDPKIEEPTVIGDTFFSPCTENWGSVGKKTLESFEFFYKNYDFDYLFRTNSSSYVDIEKLIDKIKTDDFKYAGVVGEYNGTSYVSGAGYLISNETIKIIIENSNMWNHGTHDDVALGELLKSQGIYPENKLNRKDIRSTEDEIPLNFYHYRCKQINRKDDKIVIKKINNIKKNDTTKF